MPAPDRRTANRHPELTADLRRIIGRFAMRGPGNSIETCRPREIELRFHPRPGNPSWFGHNGKVCFPDRASAQWAADAINELPGADRVAAYPCPRLGHWHHVSAERHRRTIVAILDGIMDAARQARDAS